MPPSNAKLTLRSFVYVLYCFEAGLALLVMPWSPLWPDNYYFERLRALRAVGLHPITRGIVSGLGFVLLVEGVLGFIRFALGRATTPARGDLAAAAAAAAAREEP